ncbi:MAG: flagellar export chaperone FlgN [Aminobacterium sp.]|uniref:flagellar export chaperone FlgN n=1 Tax=Aminobacterium sp. TaxID=1872491 RepID=UPI002B1E96AF|nr:flagellar export chaperone FlgN [Aminobacterium sp.]MEA4878066.1 flagellar export chaperone FlgN [Aminobacterium sp.]
MDSLELSKILLQQTDVLQKMHGVVVQQREALKEGRLELLQQLMKDQQNYAFQAETLERERQRISGRISSFYHCPSTIADFCQNMQPDVARELRQAADGLLRIVGKLQAEMAILARLVEESQTLSEITIAEWRRLEGLTSSKNGLDVCG